MRWWIKIDIISHYATSPCNRTHCYAEFAVSSPSPVLVLEMTYYVSSGTSDPTHCMYPRLGWVAFWRNFPAMEIYVGTVLRQKLITAIVPPKPDGLSIRRGGCILRHIIYLQRGGGNYWLNDVTVTWACFYNTCTCDCVNWITHRTFYEHVYSTTNGSRRMHTINNTEDRQRAQIYKSTSNTILIQEKNTVAI